MDARKPASVWMMQALAASIGCLCVIALVKYTQVVNSGGVNAIDAAARYIVLVPVLACAVLTIVGSQQRQAWARWLGLVLMGVVFAIGGLFCWIVLFVGNPRPGEIHVLPGDGLPLIIATLLMCIAVGASAIYGYSAASRGWLRSGR
ncbi:MAG: hypothetical protein ACTHL8_11795 [Burkholderiaceae bacterium]